MSEKVTKSTPNGECIGEMALLYAVLDTLEMSKRLYEMGIDVSTKAVNEYAKQCMGREPENNCEFLRALGMKILEGTGAIENFQHTCGTVPLKH